MKEQATIKDVAKLAGVSPMTVSRVLSNADHVSPKSREAVEFAMRKLNYMPNLNARKLKGERSDVIAILCVGSEGAYVSQFICEALKVCRRSGLHLVIEEIQNEQTNLFIQTSQLLNQVKPRGIILLTPLADSPQVLDFLDKSETPYVRVAPDKELERAPYIGINEYCATFEMTTSLIELGHKRIGFVRGDSQQKSSQLRFKGYMDALRSAQIDLDSAIILDGDYTYDSGLAAAEIMLALKDKPTAIVASNDDMAAGVIAVAQRRAIDVPEQLSVTGFDDSLIARLVYPKLTTVRQPLAAITEKAITILSEPPLAYSKLKKTHSRYILDYALIDRDSVKAPNEDIKNWAAG